MSRGGEEAGIKMAGAMLNTLRTRRRGALVQCAAATARFQQGRGSRRFPGKPEGLVRMVALDSLSCGAARRRDVRVNLARVDFLPSPIDSGVPGAATSSVGGTGGALIEKSLAADDDFLIDTQFKLSRAFCVRVRARLAAMFGILTVRFVRLSSICTLQGDSVCACFMLQCTFAAY